MERLFETDPQLTDSQFLSGAEKRKILKHWELFLKHGCRWEHFTNALYEHLHQHCSFIAHYDRRGFYETYFETGDDTVHFLSQFEKRKAEPHGTPRSIEYGMTYWVTGDYADINKAMIEVASIYIPTLEKVARLSQLEADVAQARLLLAKHNIELKEK